MLQQPAPTSRPKVPKQLRFLSILLFLSGFNAVYGMISGVMTAMNPPDVDSNYVNSLFEQLGKYKLPIESLQPQVESYYLNLMLELGNYGAANFLFFGIQLVGVFLMRRLNRVGFWLYTAAQFGLAVVPVIFAQWNAFAEIVLTMTVVWNLIWVIMYASQLKHFKK